MYKKTITYQTYDDEPETIVEDFWFNLTQTEMVEMNLSIAGGLEQQMNDMVIKRDVPALSKFFKEFVLKAYGVRSADGKRFIKNQQLRDEFEQSDAYNQLMIELLQGDTKASFNFLQAVMPNLKSPDGKVVPINIDTAMEQIKEENAPLAHALAGVADSEEDEEE